MINLKHFEANLLKIDKKSCKNIGIYNIGYITIKKTDDYESIYGVNPLYLQVNHANRYIEEKIENKYLIFDSSDQNKELIKKYQDAQSGIKDKIEAVGSGKCDYEKDYMKMKINSDNNLSLKKPLKLPMMTIIIRSVLEKMVNFIYNFFQMMLCMNLAYKKCQLQATYKMLEYDRIDISE